MKPTDLEPGMIMQIDPAFQDNPAFAACLFVVTEPNEFGAQGYVQGLGASRDQRGGVAYIRMKWADMEPTGGTVEWIASGA